MNFIPNQLMNFMPTRKTAQLKNFSADSEPLPTSGLWG